MPVPGPDEKEPAFVKRCVPETLRDGAAKNATQAVAICLGLYDKGQEGTDKVKEGMPKKGETKAVFLVRCQKDPGYDKTRCLAAWNESALGEGMSLKEMAFMSGCMTGEDVTFESCQLQWGEQEAGEKEDTQKAAFMKKCMAGPNATEQFCQVAYKTAMKQKKKSESEQQEKMTPVEAAFMKKCMGKEGATHETCHAAYVRQAEAREAVGSLPEYLRSVRDAFGLAVQEPARPGSKDDPHGAWARDILVNHPTFGNVVISSIAGVTYAIPFGQDAEGKPVFGAKDKWVSVTMTYAKITPKAIPTIPTPAPISATSDAVPAYEAAKKGRGSYHWEQCIIDQNPEYAEAICGTIKACIQGLGAFGKGGKKREGDPLIPSFVLAELWAEEDTPEQLEQLAALQSLASYLFYEGVRKPWELTLDVYRQACVQELKWAQLPDSAFLIVYAEDERFLPVRDVSGNIVPAWLEQAKEDVYALGLTPGFEQRITKKILSLGGSNE